MLSYTLEDIDRILKQSGIVLDIYLRKFSEVVEDSGYDFDAWLTTNPSFNIVIQAEQEPKSS